MPSTSESGSGDEETLQGRLRPDVVIRCVDGVFRREVIWHLEGAAFPTVPAACSLLTLDGKPAPSTDALLIALLAKAKPTTHTLVFVPEQEDLGHRSSESVEDLPSAAGSTTNVPNTPSSLVQTDDDRLEIFLELEKSRPEDLSLDDKLSVIGLNQGTGCEDILHLGDVVLAMDGLGIRSLPDFLQRFQKACKEHREVKLVISRSFIRRREREKMLVPPAVRETLKMSSVARYLSREVKFEGDSLGVVLETLSGRVVVVKVVPGTPGASVFRRWDIMCILNQNPVNEARPARAIIQGSGKHFTCLLERSTEPQPPPWMEAELRELITNRKRLHDAAAAAGQKDTGSFPDFLPPPDVRNIAAKALTAWTSDKSRQPLPSVFRQGTLSHSQPARKSVSCSERPGTEVPIPSDTPAGVALRPVLAPARAPTPSAKSSASNKP